MAEEEEIATSFRWESGNVMQRTWDAVAEDAEGNLIASSVLHSSRERYKRASINRVSSSIRRGLIRFMIVCTDCSLAAAEKDFRPCRLEVSKAALTSFIADFFDQNPLSQLGVCLTGNRTAKIVTELAGNPKNHIAKLRDLPAPEGMASLQNTLLIAIEKLKHCPSYGSREVLILFSSLSTCDPGDIYETIAEAKALYLRCSVICLVADVYVCRRLTEITGGSYAVALDQRHYNELVQQFTVPPPEMAPSSDNSSENNVVLSHGHLLKTEFIYMGFPTQVIDPTPVFGYHNHEVFCGPVAGNGTPASSDESAVLPMYVCPQCQTRVSTIPSHCDVCGLQLNSSSHIARSFHHLTPVEPFVQCARPSTIPPATVTSQPLTLKLSTVKSFKKRKMEEPLDDAPATSPVTSCQGCMTPFAHDSLQLQCPSCNLLFCEECDIFIHDVLHNCIGVHD